jgi:hypothetical protein
MWLRCKKRLYVRVFEASIRKFGYIEHRGLRLSDQTMNDRDGVRLEKIRQVLTQISEFDPESFGTVREAVRYLVVGHYRRGPRFVPWIGAILIPVPFVERERTEWIASIVVHQAASASLVRKGIGGKEAFTSDVVARQSLLAQIRFLKRLGSAETARALEHRGRARWPANADLFDGAS